MCGSHSDPINQRSNISDAVKSVRRLLGRWGVAASAVGLLCGALWFARSARADQAEDYTATHAGVVCASLDAYPSFTGVSDVGARIVADSGMTYEDAGRVIVKSVLGSCPRYLGLLQRFVAQYGGGAQLVARHVGGRVGQ